MSPMCPDRTNKKDQNYHEAQPPPPGRVLFTSQFPELLPDQADFGQKPHERNSERWFAPISFVQILVRDLRGEFLRVRNFVYSNFSLGRSDNIRSIFGINVGYCP
jgi:hypothetical protein